ncbi:MAG: hypothetical protein LBU42_00535 [Prevotellaceae bacterium]|jgi:hypothetical protein|nr:hypothetical protein [Prevotellaceae bacterium]
MESLVPIIIAIAFLVLQAIAAGNKKKEAARRQMQRQERPPGYAPRPVALPQRSPFEQLLETMREQGAIGEVEEEEIVETVAGTPEETEKILYPAYRKTALEETPLPAASSAAVTPKAAAIPMNEEEENAFAEPQKEKHWFFSEPFDAGKAIVYSEIIRPKWKED